MESLRRVWIQEKSFDEKAFLDTVTIYDGGDFQGILAQTSKGKQWSGYHIVERKPMVGGGYIETLRPAHEFFSPLGFFSIDTYPARVEGSTLWIPGWKISLQPHAQSTSDFQSQEQSLHQQTLRPKQRQRQQPFPPPCPPHPSPSSLPLLKLPSVTQVQSQPPSQNNRKNASKQKALSSSNSTFHEKPTQSAQVRLEGSLSPPSPVDHIVQQSQWYPLFQLSLSPPLHEAPGGSNPQPTSSSPRHSNSGQNLPSRQVQHRSSNKPRRPTSSTQTSREQIAPVPAVPF